MPLPITPRVVFQCSTCGKLCDVEMEWKNGFTLYTERDGTYIIEVDCQHCQKSNVIYEHV